MRLSAVLALCLLFLRPSSSPAGANIRAGGGKARGKIAVWKGLQRLHRALAPRGQGDRRGRRPGRRPGLRRSHQQPMGNHRRSGSDVSTFLERAARNGVSRRPRTSRRVRTDQGDAAAQLFRNRHRKRCDEPYKFPHARPGRGRGCVGAPGRLDDRRGESRRAMARSWTGRLDTAPERGGSLHGN